MSALRQDSLTLAEAARIMREHALATPGATWLYAIQAGGYGGDIKLGISRDPIARLRTLQVAHSETLRGLGAWPGTVADERQLHEMYAGTRLRGEWFIHSLPMWRLIHDLGGGFEWAK